MGQKGQRKRGGQNGMKIEMRFQRHSKTTKSENKIEREDRKVKRQTTVGEITFAKQFSKLKRNRQRERKREKQKERKKQRNKEK